MKKSGSKNLRRKPEFDNRDGDDGRSNELYSQTQFVDYKNGSTEMDPMKYMNKKDMFPVCS